MEFGFINLLVLPAALGLFGFIEPCSIGSSLIFIKYLERKEAARKLAETILFAATRALFIGALGVLAALLGTAFLGWQKGAWILLGAVYVAMPATARRARSSTCGSSTTRRGGGGWRSPCAPTFPSNIRWR